MTPATRPSSLADSDMRARNGGTSTPAGSSVWDIEPADPARPAPPAEAVTLDTEVPPAESPPVAARDASPLLPSSIRVADRAPGILEPRRPERSGPRDLFADTPLSNAMLPEHTSPAVLAALEPDRPVDTDDVEPEGDGVVRVRSNTLAGVDRRLLLLLVLVSVMSLAAWVVTRDTTDGLATFGDGAELEQPGQFESGEPGGSPIAEPATDAAATSSPPVAPGGAADEVADADDEAGGASAVPPANTPADPSPPADSLPPTDAVPVVEAPPAEPAEPTADVQDPDAVPAVAPDATAPPADDASAEPDAEPDAEPEAQPPVAPPAEDTSAPVVDDGRRVDIVTRIAPCRFGSACLIAGFDVVGFDALPDTFVCEFANGSRYEFDLPDGSVTTACATGSRGSSITIEVDGVRSATVVFD